MHVKRFYENDLPELNDLVMVKVIREEEEFGYYCALVEYEDLEGFLPLSELVKKKYAKKHLLKPGQMMAMFINKVEKQNRIINLSRKRVTEEEDNNKKELFKTCDDINKLVNEYYVMYISYQKKTDHEIVDVNKFMKETIWTLYECISNDYNKAYDFILKNPTSILPTIIFDEALIVYINTDVGNRITHTSKIMILDLKLLVIDENPVTIIQEILNLDTIKISNYKIEIFATASPHYRIKIEGPLKVEDVEQDIIEIIKNQIIENSKKYNTVIEINNPIVEKESSFKIKYYSKNALLKL